VRVVITHPTPAPAAALLERAGHDVVVGPGSSTEPELHELVRGADGAITWLVDRIDDAFLDAAGPQLRVVSNYAVGLDNVDLATCARRGVKVGHTPGVLTGAVAELAVALVLAVARQIVVNDRDLRSKGSLGWGHAQLEGMELRGRTLGVVGAGRIGSAVAAIAHDGLGMEVVYTGRSEKADVAGRRVDLEELLRRSDVVVVTIALAAETHHLIGAQELASMRPDAILVNVSRGPIVDEHALVEALRAGRIAGAGLDVYEFEPDPLPELLELDNVTVTPHVGSATAETRAAMARLAAENVLAGISGRPLPAEATAQKA
jgi:glyoxylate reductase